jgi:hypothetical protein
MIFTLPGTRGLGDLRLFWHLERPQGRIPALSSRPAILDVTHGPEIYFGGVYEEGFVA